MDLWWNLAGTWQVRLTGADPVASLRQLARQIRLERIQWESELTVTFWIARADRQAVRSLARHRGDRVEVVQKRGFPQLWKTACGMPLISGLLVILTAASIWLPSRVLFLCVEGNRQVPTAQILEEAAACGVRFGASRRHLRSEQIKNELLLRIPDLSWAGVNTRGCTARISVRERRPPELPPERLTGDIVAGRDGVIAEVIPESGTPVCTVGQTVRKGQVLISGLTDLGHSTRIGAAKGAVFAYTAAEYTAVLPRKTGAVVQSGRTVQKFSLVLGKKRIKIGSDSGILYPGCGKMREAIPLCLPGGWQLPVTLVKDTYFLTSRKPAERPRARAEAALLQSILRDWLDHRVAGEIRTRQLRLEESGGCLRMHGSIGGREMIGRTTEGVYLEDDARDD